MRVSSPCAPPRHNGVVIEPQLILRRYACSPHLLPLNACAFGGAALSWAQGYAQPWVRLPTPRDGTRDETAPWRSRHPRLIRVVAAFGVAVGGKTTVQELRRRS